MMLGPHSSKALCITLLVLVGLGQGILFSSLQFSAQAAVEQHNQGRSAAMYTFMRSIGMALGVALGGAVFQNVLQERTRSLGLDPGLARDITAYIFAARSKGPSALGELLVESLANSLRDVFLTLTCFSAGAFVVSLLIKHHSMDG
ncbi:hypothetical protein Vi05172_g4249 [Venturia inaequalis]|nr:hypothetical protein Vi05172_g4249 [Venturia inaequalis]